MKHSRFLTDDGLKIAFQECGNPAGPAIVFIHGYSQCHLSWSHQFDSPLASEFRLISYDIRGHGGSDKPQEPQFYHEGERWAGELSRLLEVTDARDAVIVAWSYAGRIVSDYLHAYGAERLAGINLVGSKTRSDPAFVGKENVLHQSRMASDDIAENVTGTIGFLRTCAARWSSEEFERHLAFSMLVPPGVRRHLGGRRFDADHLYTALGIPVLFTHGTVDRVVPIESSRAGHAICPTSTLSVYDGIGHAPFVEDVERFNAELAAFVRRCRR